MDLAEAFSVKVKVAVDPSSQASFTKQIQDMANKAIINVKVNLDTSGLNNQMNGLNTATQNINRQVNNSVNSVSKSIDSQINQLKNLINTVNSISSRTGNNPAYSSLAPLTNSAINQMADMSKLVPGTDQYNNALKGLQNTVSTLTREYGLLNKEITNTNQIQKEQQAQANLRNQMQSYLSKYPKIESKPEALNQYNQIFNSIENGASQARIRFAKFQGQMRDMGMEAQSLGERLKELFTKHLDIAVIMVGIHALQKGFQQVTQNVIELDKALTNLQIVNGGTQAQAKELLNTYSQMAQVLGATTVQVADSATEWMRQGFSLEDTNKLIENSMVLSKIGFVSSAESTQYLTSAMKGFNVEAEDSIRIVDRLSKVDVEAAVSAGGIAEAMARTSASAELAGVSMDKLIGYIATVGEVTQREMSTVGENFKTLFARMGNIKAGRLIDPETSENLSDVESTLSGLGIMLRDTDSEFRNFGDVLDEVGGKWDSFSSVQQHAISVAFAGKLYARIYSNVKMCA